MKKLLTWGCWIFMLLLLAVPAHADLTVIGVAGYDADGEDGIEADEYFNLIWSTETDLVWLDYTNEPTYWSNGSYQLNWAAGLGSELDIQLYDGYSVTWTEDAWHLPDTEMVTAQDDGGWLDTSDLGQLFYVELGNVKKGGLVNTGPFENLNAVRYLENSYDQESTYAIWIWYFSMSSGYERCGSYYNPFYAIAVRGAQVSVVPVPGTLMLLSCGLLGIAGFRRKSR